MTDPRYETERRACHFHALHAKTHVKFHADAVGKIIIEKNKIKRETNKIKRKEKGKAIRVRE